MNQREDEGCMSMFLDKVIVNRVQGPGLTPFEEFLPRSAPLVDFVSIGFHSGADGSILQQTLFTGSRKTEVSLIKCWATRRLRKL